jgi:hypothetical protein
MTLATATALGWIGFAAAVALGLWLILGRAKWARDVYQPPLNPFGRFAPLVPAALGVLVIAAAVWALKSGM